MSLIEPFSEVNTLLNSSDERKTSSTAVPGWLKSFAKKQKIGGRSSVASSDALPQSAAVRAPVDVSAVDDYLDDFIKHIAGGRYGPASQPDSRDRDRDRDMPLLGQGQVHDHVMDLSLSLQRYRDRQYTQMQRPRKFSNIQLNQQIMRVSDTRELCHIILTHAAEFDDVNVAAGFRKVLQVPRTCDGVLLQQALQTLEKCAMRNMEAFQPQDIANICTS
jgi:hypothetical protein